MNESTDRIIIHDCNECPLYNYEYNDLLPSCSLSYKSFQLCELHMITTKKQTFVRRVI